MHLSELQAHVGKKLEAAQALAAFGKPLVFSHFTDDQAARELIDKSLRAYGVCIEVGVIEASGDGEKPQNRYSLLDARFDVYVAESPEESKKHTPSDMELVAAVATAVQARSATSDPAIRCIGYAAAKSENGYILHALSFTSPVVL